MNAYVTTQIDVEIDRDENDNPVLESEQLATEKLEVFFTGKTLIISLTNEHNGDAVNIHMTGKDAVFLRHLLTEKILKRALE